MENKPIKKINSIAELVMMLGSKSNITDEEKREIRERIDELRAKQEKPISKINNMSQLVMKLEKGNPTEAERLEIKQQLEKLRVKRAKKDKTDPPKVPLATKVPLAPKEPTLGEKTMMLRQYYANKYGQKPVVNDPFKIINLEPEAPSISINRGCSSSSCSSSINTEVESTSDCGILKQLEKDYDIIEIKISMRKK
jgi:hypothetical protein